MTSKAPRRDKAADLDDGWGLPDESPSGPVTASSELRAFPTGEELDDGWVLPPEWEALLDVEPEPVLARGSGPIEVPAPEPEPAPVLALDPAPDLIDARLDLNAATAAELCTLPGIGAKRAARVIALREQSGGFDSVDQLSAVSGIGKKTLEQLRALLVVRIAV
jgi:competence ComEA-like helix-hairpin-helix protein